MTYGGDLQAGGAMALNGQEVGAWMMDSYAGTLGVTETEVVTDGGFAADLSNWTDASTGTGSVAWNAGGYADLTAGTPYASNLGGVSQNITCVVGQAYTVSADHLDTNAMRLSISSVHGETSTTIETVSFTFTATSTTHQVAVYAYADGVTTSVDNISVKVNQNLLSNGEFNLDISSWTDASTGTGSVAWNASGYLDLTSVDSSNQGIVYQAITTVVGKNYVLTVDHLDTDYVAFSVGTTALGNQNFSNGHSSIATFSKTFTAKATTTYISILGPYSSAATASVDNVSVSEVTIDQIGSTTTPMLVNGTLTTTVVATGSDLVGYSGFGVSDYLSQAYDSAFDIVPATTGLFISGWYKGSYLGETILDRCDTGLLNQRYRLGMDTNGYADFLTDDNTTSNLITGTTNIADGNWHHIVATLDTNGLKSLYVDGELESTGTPSTNNTLANASAIVSIGIQADSSTYITQGGLALIKVGAFAPTASEVRRMFAIESQLFDAGEPLGIIPKVNGASQTGSSIVADGYPASVLAHAEGDFINIGLDRKTYQVPRDVYSDSNGNVTIPIYPALYATPGDNASIRYDRPILNVRAPNGIVKYSAGYPQKYSWQMDFREDPR